MDEKDKNVLQSNRELIYKDLHGDVIINLLRGGIINPDEYNNINSFKFQHERNERFLEILCQKKNGLHPFMVVLKDMYWWIEEKLRELLEEKWENTIHLTNIPPIHRRNVSRNQLLQEVRGKLKNLEKGHYVVLHGMSGCGKSSLAAEALHHDILIEKFQGKVCWLSCCQDSKPMKNKEERKVDENEILALQVQLNEKLSNEELVSNVGAASWKKLNNQLRNRFKNSDFKEGLLVLDDVHSAQIIDALNIGCKTLVITHDKCVMKFQGNRYQDIKVSEGFTESETLEHLAKCVDLPIEKLPKQARQIHQHGKGHPLIISLIGAQLEAHREESKNNFDSWNNYLEVLIDKNYGNLKRWSFGGENSPLPGTIDLCINSLSCQMREKYYDFALFVEDVNIDIQVLEILWNLPKFDVKCIMSEFLNKSLIVSKYNTTKNCYVYGIHDLLLYHLKTHVHSDDARVNLHKKLIERYKQKCEGDVAKLPKNDNYFYYYIGHHIAQAKLFTLFSEWYFNLDFIESKLKVAGPGDLLLDYKRYEPHFSDGCFDAPKIAKKLTDFVKFVEAAGMDVRRNNGPDIIQLALQEPQDSEVHKTAKKVAHSRTNTTYLHFPLGPSISRSGPHLVQTKEKVSVACFLKDNSLLVGYESGIIKIIREKADSRTVREYRGHSSFVSRLEVSEAETIFLSVCKNDINIWILPELDSTGFYSTGDRTPSPSQRQTDFTFMFNDLSLETKTSWLSIQHETCVTWATFSNNGSQIAFCSLSNKVDVMQINNNSVYVTRRIRAHASCCIFSQHDDMLIIGCNSSQILIHDIVNNIQISQIGTSYPILELFSLPVPSGEMKFGALTKATLCVWELEPKLVDKNKTNNVPCLKDYNRGEEEFYEHCAVVPDTATVAVATSTGKILICDLHTGTVMWEVGDSSRNIKYLAMDKSKDHKLLACTDDSLIKIWTLGELQSGKHSSMKKNFAVTWLDRDTFVLVAPTYKNCIKKVTGRSQFEQDLEISVNCEVNTCAISKCGKIIVASTSDREVFIHVDGTDSKMVKILTLEENINTLKVEKLGSQVWVAIGCDRALTVWMSEEGSILEPDSAITFKKSFQEKLVDYYIEPSVKRLITVTQNGSIKGWKLDDEGELISELCAFRLDVTIISTDLSCNNDLVTLDCQRKFLNIYRLGENSGGRQFKLKSPPTCCSFSADGEKLVIAFENKQVEVRDMSSPGLCSNNPVVLDAPVYSVCVSNTGLVGAATARRVVMKPADGRLGQAKLQVDRVCMSPDDRTVITVDSEGLVHLIEVLGSASDDFELSMKEPERQAL